MGVAVVVMVVVAAGFEGLRRRTSRLWGSRMCRSVMRGSLMRR